MDSKTPVEVRPTKGSRRLRKEASLRLEGAAIVATDRQGRSRTFHIDGTDNSPSGFQYTRQLDDGGYYLIGLKQPAEKLFIGVPWSTDQVFAVTQQQAKTMGLSVGLTTAWRDLDTIEDLQALITECREDNKKPKQDRTFSMRTAGTLQLLATRLKTR